MPEDDTPHLAHRFAPSQKLLTIFLAVFLVAILAGVGTGYILASSSSKTSSIPDSVVSQTTKVAGQDNRTFRDFAEGTIQAKDAKKSDYSEGTHILVRENAVPVALTSSVVDLSKYEGKKVKVYGETQKAVKEGWLMDVGRVEEK